MSLGQECSACGGVVRTVRGSYDMAQLQMPGVVLHGIDLITCEICGNVDPVIPRLSRIMEVLAVARIRKPCPLAGEDVEALRTHLRMDRQRLASLLHIEQALLERWERGQEAVDPQTDRLLRAVTLILGQGLKEDVEGVLHSLEAIPDEPCTLRIELDAEAMEYHYVRESAPLVSR